MPAGSTLGPAFIRAASAAFAGAFVEGRCVWSFVGLGIACSMAVIAWQRSRKPGGFYDADVYALTPRSHRAYALTFLAFAIFFAIAIALRQVTPGVAALALLVLAAVFYAASFLRGASDADD
jgi:hypothetical protein